jgi:nitrogen fixation protein NifT
MRPKSSFFGYLSLRPTERSSVRRLLGGLGSTPVCGGVTQTAKFKINQGDKAMRATIRRSPSGKLTVYIAKKDLEEEVLDRTLSDEGEVLTLVSGQNLLIPFGVLEGRLPVTIELKRLKG